MPNLYYEILLLYMTGSRMELKIIKIYQIYIVKSYVYLCYARGHLYKMRLSIRNKIYQYLLHAYSINRSFWMRS